MTKPFALVTGGSAGFGLELAGLLASDDHQPLPPGLVCFTSILDDPQTVLAQACWGVRCGPGFAPLLQGGSCACQDEATTGGQQMLPEA